jgi:2-polyprenyl-3-methyl-5-hydroxy-6-metoxy-1,4-benzoquinol methylase
MNWESRKNIGPNGPSETDFPVAVNTPHSQAWGIPEEFFIEELPLRMTDNQLQSMVLTIWREFILNDEVLSAISFLENAPYRVRHTEATTRALNITKKSIEWMFDHSKSQTINTPRDPNGVPFTIEVGNILPDPLTGQLEGRSTWITNRLTPGCSLIDFGCIDGSMTNRWGMSGFKVTGVDLSMNSISIANKKAIQFNTGAKHICSYFKNIPNHIIQNSFDVATCSDTYEHLIDPIVDLLEPARKCLSGHGRMLLVTPHGAWFRGKFLSWAHPWSWYKSGSSWLKPEPRAHLVAPTVWSVADHFRKSKWWVKSSEVVIQSYGDVPGQGNVCVEAFVNPPPVWPGLDIVVLGSNFELAESLALLGNRVRHFGPWDEEKISNFVDHIFDSKLFDIKCDVLISDTNVDSVVSNKIYPSSASASDVINGV